MAVRVCADSADGGGSGTDACGSVPINRVAGSTTNSSPSQSDLPGPAVADNPVGAESVVVVVVLSVVEVELSEVVNSSFSSLHEMMLRLINEMEITYIVFLIELS